MINALPFTVKLLLVCAAVLTSAWLVAVLAERVTRAWRSATVVGRSLFVFAGVIATLFGGAKNNPTNLTGLVGFALPPPSFDPPSVTPEDISRGWQLWETRTNDAVSFVMPEGAVLASNWWAHGAFEDVRRVPLPFAFPLASNGYDTVWASVWGRLRPHLRDVSDEIVAVGAPMAAVPGRSRFWTAVTTNACLLTWEDFTLGRLAATASPTSSLVSAQIELKRNGDFITRSNAVERLCRRIDPDDLDGDGWPNEVDADPYRWDDVPMPLYQELPAGANEDAYCWIEIETEWNGWVSFVGDGPSDLSDPCFDTRAGEPTRVMLLVGKTYDVVSDVPISVVARSDGRIEVRDQEVDSFTVEWPVSIWQETGDSAAPLMMSSAPLLSGAHWNDGFTMAVSPACLGGTFDWPTNGCCRIVGDADGWYFACNWDCHCGGCYLSGSYTYEGYALVFSGIRCGCHYESDPQTLWTLSVPSVVFKDGALKPLGIQFLHGDPDDPEEGTLRLIQTSGSSRIRLWEDAGRTQEASQFEWDVSSFGGCTYYVEGVETSVRVGDVGFRLVWDRPGGSSADQSASLTCAEVENTDVSSWYMDDALNPPPFDGHTNWHFDVTHSPTADRHFAVHFHEVVGADYAVRDFDVDMALTVRPAGAPVGTATWFALDPTPDSGSVVSTGARTGALRNPKKGGVYHIGSTFVGSPTNECNIVLPLAGAEMSGVLEGDLAFVDRFVIRARRNCSLRWYSRPWFGWKWFCHDDVGFYRGRPDSSAAPTVWYYNQVSDSDGKGAVGTLNGVPMHVEKLSNLIVAYACEGLGVPASEQELSQLFGTPNDELADLSWRAGTNLAHGVSFDTEIEALSLDARRFGSQKSRKLWPNTEPVENHQSQEQGIVDDDEVDFNRVFLSPGFIYADP